MIRISREDPRRPTEVRSDLPQGNSRGWVLPDDRILVWGSFTGVGGWISPGVARLRHDLVPDRSFRSALPAGSRTQAGCVQSDGRVLLAQGPSAGVNGPGSAELRRLMDDGTLDPTFRSPGRLDGPVHALTVDHQGRILVAGAFRKIDGRPLASVIRLNPDGSLDDSFVRGGGADRAVRALFVEPDDNVIAHGDFRWFDGQECWGLVRVGGGIAPHVEPRVLGVSSSRSAEAGERVVLGAVTAGGLH